MFCMKCGTQLPDTAKFCGKCGTRIPRLERTDNRIQERENTLNASEAPAYGSNGTELITSNASAASAYGSNGTELITSNASAAPAYGSNGTELITSNASAAPAYGSNGTELITSNASAAPAYGSNGTELITSNASAASAYGSNGTELITSNASAVPAYGSNGTEIIAPMNASGSDEIQTPPEYGQMRENSNSNKDGEVKPLNPGDIIGGFYRVVEKIGKGGFGYVYKAYHTRLESTVVIKQIHKPNTGLSNRTEADVLKKIKHTYLPQVYDFIEKDGTAFTIMDFVPGADIDKLMNQGRKFRQKEIIKVAVELCEAVKYLHGCTPPIIHSDIKPENIMLAENGDICLIDMNVSLVFDNNESLIGGTADFAPPEQMGVPLGEIRNGVSKLTLKRKCTPRIDERSDIYSIGASIYYMALGKVPAIDYSTNPIADFAAAGLSEPLASIVAKAMALNPAKRYKSAGEMLTALNNLGKLDRRYKMLQIQRTVVTALCAVMTFAFVSISRMGYDKMKEEHEEKYQSYVLQIENSIRSGDYDAAGEIIALAKEFEPSRIEPYLNEAKIYSNLGDYERCAEYPDKILTTDIFNNSNNSREMFAQIYEIAANGAFELEQYNDAVENYQEALRYSPKIIECYRDLTISYARLGNIELAEESLEKARELGITDDRLDLMQGEISVAKGEFSEAFDSFNSAIQKTNDNYVRFRSLLACDKAAIADGQAMSAMKVVMLLESELDNVTAEYSGTVREMLANEYARCGELLDSSDYYRKAADCYREIMDEGILSYQLKKNYFNILFTQLKEYDSCAKLLDAMEQENALDYWIPMNKAYLEITLQNMISDQSKRDYSAAYNSFLKADELYGTYTQNGKSDPNMDTLRSSINSLKSFGWI